MTETVPKLDEIALRLDAHLARMEAPRPGRRWSGCWHPAAWKAGNRVAIRYVVHQNEWTLPKADALAYLAWLDAGNEGRHLQFEILKLTRL